MRAHLTAADLAETTGWQKSSFSTPNSDNCVEVAAHGAGVAIRNSNDPESGGLAFTTAEMAAFVAGAKAGEFDRFI